jgi:transcriptional regulator with XRE-family HTH domain
MKRTAQFLDSPINRHLREDISAKRVEKVAAAVGVTQDAVRQWRSGYTQPRLGTVVKLAEYLGVTTDYLLGKEVAPTHKQSYTYQQTGLSHEALAAILSLSDEQKADLSKLLSSINLAGIAIIPLKQ